MKYNLIGLLLISIFFSSCQDSSAGTDIDDTVSWTQVSDFYNGWAQDIVPYPEYGADALNNIHLRGRLQDTDSFEPSTLMFKIPPSFAPKNTIEIAVPILTNPSGSSIGIVSIYPSPYGEVHIKATNGENISKVWLGEIVYRVD